MAQTDIPSLEETIMAVFVANVYTMNQLKLTSVFWKNRKYFELVIEFLDVDICCKTC
jgi:hypothetical protein